MSFDHPRTAIPGHSLGVRREAPDQAIAPPADKENTALDNAIESLEFSYRHIRNTNEILREAVVRLGGSWPDSSTPEKEDGKVAVPATSVVDRLHLIAAHLSREALKLNAVTERLLRLV